MASEPTNHDALTNFLNEPDISFEDAMNTRATPVRCDELVTEKWEAFIVGDWLQISGEHAAWKHSKVRELVTRQNAEEVIAAKDARIKELEKLCNDPVIQAEFETVDDGIIGTRSVDVKRVEREDDDSLTVVIDYWPTPSPEVTTMKAENERLREALERIADWPNGGKNYGQENIKRFARTALRGGETMKDLIDRLSKLDGPDREVDAEICILFQYGGKNSEGATNVRTDPEWCDSDLLFEIGDEDCCNPIPELTSSVDAAIALAERVLPEHRWSVGFSRHVPHNAQIWAPSGSGYYEGESDVNKAIALCIAILRAKETNHDV